MAESVRHFYDIYGGGLKGKSVIVQGWGNVAAPAAYYLAQEGARIVGNHRPGGGLIKRRDFPSEEVKDLWYEERGTFCTSDELLPFDVVNEQIWSVGAEVFIPAAASRLVTHASSGAVCSRTAWK